MTAHKELNLQLADAIDLAFAVDELPRDDLVERGLAEQDYADEVAADLEEWRKKAPNKDLLRQMHQELRKLSPAATRWIFPHYLRYALGNESKYSLMEVSYFVLSLISRGNEEDAQVARRLSLLGSEQMFCLKKVLLYLKCDAEWSAYMGEDVEEALATLDRIFGI